MVLLLVFAAAVALMQRGPRPRRRATRRRGARYGAVYVTREDGSKGFEKGGTCEICMTEIEENEELGEPCENSVVKHVQHKECSDEWRARTNSCPVCRVSYKSNPELAPVDNMESSELAEVRRIREEMDRIKEQAVDHSRATANVAKRVWAVKKPNNPERDQKLVDLQAWIDDYEARKKRGNARARERDEWIAKSNELTRLQMEDTKVLKTAIKEYAGIMSDRVPKGEYLIFEYYEDELLPTVEWTEEDIQAHVNSIFDDLSTTDAHQRLGSLQSTREAAVARAARSLGITEETAQQPL